MKKRLSLKNYKPPKDVGPNLNDPTVRAFLHWQFLLKGKPNAKNNKNN